MQHRNSISRPLVVLGLLGSIALGATVLGGSPVSAQGPPERAGFVMFRGASFPVEESEGSVDVIVRRHNGDTGEVTVDIATVDGSAIAGEDYVAGAATLTWADGDHADKSLTIEILADDVAEGLETFGVLLSNPTGGVEIGALSSTVVRIVPEDEAATTTAMTTTCRR